MRHRAGARVALRFPLVRAGGTLGQLPFETEQVLEKVVAPLRGSLAPGDFQAAGDRVTGMASAEGVVPAEALGSDIAALAVGSHMGGRAGAVSFAEGMPPGDERDGLFVVHGHARKGL